jgi:hypothetical protein
VTGLDPVDELVDVLRRLGPLLVVHDRRYRTFHKSFTDCLVGWDERLDSKAGSWTRSTPTIIDDLTVHAGSGLVSMLRARRIRTLTF